MLPVKREDLGSVSESLLTSVLYLMRPLARGFLALIVKRPCLILSMIFYLRFRSALIVLEGGLILSISNVKISFDFLFELYLSFWMFNSRGFSTEDF